MLSRILDDTYSTRSTAFGCYEDIEYYFGISILDENGQTFEEYEETRQDGEPDAWEPANPLKFRLSPNYDGFTYVPESYPCIAVSWLESTYDRMGEVNIRALSYVYPREFE